MTLFELNVSLHLAASELAVLQLAVLHLIDEDNEESDGLSRIGDGGMALYHQSRRPCIEYRRSALGQKAKLDLLLQWGTSAPDTPGLPVRGRTSSAPSKTCDAHQR